MSREPPDGGECQKGRSRRLALALPVIVIVASSPHAMAMADAVSGTGSAPSSLQPRFRAERAFEILEQLVASGNRYYGAPKRDLAIRDLERRLRPYAPSISRQTFSATESRSGESYSLSNIVARIRPEAETRILLGSHWDTRLWAEEDPSPMQRSRPIPGANDGTSGVAVLLEAARVLSTSEAFEAIGFDIVLFDGEEFGRPGNGDYCRGSIHFADHISHYYPAKLPAAAIILDMVGDRELRLPRERGSNHGRSKWVKDTVWRVGRRVDSAVFSNEQRPAAIIDDHTALQRIGIPAILIIDLDYPHWHTHRDTVDEVSAESLGIVGRVLIESLPEVHALAESTGREKQAK